MKNVDGAPVLTGQLLTVAQVAKRLHFTDRHVRALVAKGEFGSIKIGRSRRFTEQHIADFLAAHEVVTARTTDVPGQLELELGLRPAESPPQTPAGTRLAA